MDRPKANEILQKRNAVIEAPAGHGKTEMIADLVECSEGRRLLLTHTNAGVEAIERRMSKRGIPDDRYEVYTIAGFCVKWCKSYVWAAEIDESLSQYEEKQRKAYYGQMYSGAKKIFSHPWAREVLCATYSGVIVDEYQDCTVSQHEIFKVINDAEEWWLPVVALGDPMQAIYSFAGELVDLDKTGFEKIDVSTSPHRWENSNPALGEYLQSVRDVLMPTLRGCQCKLSVRDCECVRLIEPADFYSDFLAHAEEEFEGFSSVVFLTKWPGQQLYFCKTATAGDFKFDETQECEKLYEYASEFDAADGEDLVHTALGFLNECAIGVSEEIESETGRRRGESGPQGGIWYDDVAGTDEFLRSFVRDGDKPGTLLSMLEWAGVRGETVKIYREELFWEMVRSVLTAQSEGLSITEAARAIRTNPAYRKNYTAKNLSSRVLLSKGLEFDCAIIDMRFQSDVNVKSRFTAKEFYVAMTRAMRRVYIVTSSDELLFLS